MWSEHLWKLIDSENLKNKAPLSEGAIATIQATQQEIEDVLAWKSNKKIMIVWPCSADFEDSLLEYAQKLKELKEKYGDEIVFVMRFYTWKPRTVGGWKWLQQGPLEDINNWELNTKDLTEEEINNFNEWLIYSRKLAIKIIEESGIGLADEMLHPQLYNHFDDIYSYLAVGARSTENQYHREVSSWATQPIWMKNSTDWNVITWVNSVESAQKWWSICTIWNNIYRWNWNEYAHLILRGGNGKPNYDLNFIQEAYKEMIKRWIENPSVIIDLNHENSWKKPEEQKRIMLEVLDSIKDKPELKEFVKGFMCESYIKEWRQDFPKNWDFSKITHGLSLTDPCSSIEETAKICKALSDDVKKWRIAA